MRERGQGEARTIPVRVGGVHRGLVVMHSPAEHERYWRGVDREASRVLARSATTARARR